MEATLTKDINVDEQNSQLHECGTDGPDAGFAEVDLFAVRSVGLIECS